MRPATPAEIDRWDDLVLSNPDGGNMLQTRAWGEFKRSWGWQPAYLVSDDLAMPWRRSFSATTSRDSAGSGTPPRGRPPPPWIN